MQLVDSHCHIQSVEADTGEASTRAMWIKAETTADDVIARAHEQGVVRMVCVGCDLEDSRLAVDFVKSRENCWASIGIHPHEASRYVGQDGLLGQFAELAPVPKVVAIGECGLDYFYENSDKASQRAVLEFQLELALRHDLPVIFHVREAFDDFWPIFERYNTHEHPIRGVLHSFTDSQANLERVLGRGLYIGVNGIATFTKKSEQQEMFRQIPLKSLLLETDSPFLTPAPNRGKICEPYHIRTIAEFLAAFRGETVEAIAAATTANAQQLFGI